MNPRLGGRINKTTKCTHLDRRVRTSTTRILKIHFCIREQISTHNGLAAVAAESVGVYPRGWR